MAVFVVICQLLYMFANYYDKNERIKRIILKAGYNSARVVVVVVCMWYMHVWSMHVWSMYYVVCGCVCVRGDVPQHVWVLEDNHRLVFSTLFETGCLHCWLLHTAQASCPWPSGDSCLLSCDRNAEITIAGYRTSLLHRTRSGSHPCKTNTLPSEPFPQVLPFSLILIPQYLKNFTTTYLD